MKTFLFTLSAFLLVSSSAFAAGPTLRCSLVLLTPIVASNPGRMWISPDAMPYTFDYDMTTEKTVKLTVAVENPSSEIKQYALDTAKSADDTVLTIEFSKTSPDGNHFEGTNYGVYMRTPTDGLHPYWELGGQDGFSATRQFHVSKDVLGYFVMICQGAL